MIHPTAVIHPRARLAADVEVGPYAVIDGDVELGAACVVGPHVYLTGQVLAGEHNLFLAGCVIGEAPQDLKYKGAPTGVRIGSQNIFREHVTVHRSTTPGEWTQIGSHCLLMASSHVGHNSVVGNQVIMANGCLLGGYARVDDRAFISGCCLVHQFTRVGTLAMMQGGAAVSKDLPPFTIARRGNTMSGLNVIGLRRAGISPVERLELKRLYRFLFRSGLRLQDAVQQARAQFQAPVSVALLDFVATAKRGVCADKSVDRGSEEEDELT